MKSKRPFTPGFLNRLDNTLLRNNPEIWSTRAHLVVYYCSLFLLALTVLCYILPNSPLSPSTAIYWAGFLSLISIIAFVIWMIFLLRFNVFKRFGIINAKNTVLTFLLYFLCSLFIVFIPYVPALVESYKANKEFDSEQLVKDINEMNVDICKLEYKTLPKEWYTDTLFVVDTILSITYDEETNTTVYMRNNVIDSLLRSDHSLSRSVVDSSGLFSEISAADSSVKLNDSTYIKFSCPDYIFIHTYYSNEDLQTKNHQLTSNDISRDIIQKYKKENEDLIRRKLQSLIFKYSLSDFTYATWETRESYEELIERKYNILGAKAGIRNLLKRKYLWKGDTGASLIRSIFYISFILSLFIFAFRHTTIKNFFVSLLTGALITILSGAIFAVTDGEYDFIDMHVNFYYLLYFTIACIVSSFVFKNKTRKPIAGICINIFMATLAFVPLSVVALTDQILQWQYYRYRQQDTFTVNDKILNGQVIPLTDYPPDLSLYYQWAEIIGPILFIIILYFFIHKLYRRWYALPED